VPLANGERLRVLVLDEEAPWPLDSGKRIRSWNLLQRLAIRHDLHFFAYGPVSLDARAEFDRHHIRITETAQLPPSRGSLFWLRLFGNLFSGLPYSVSKHFTARLQREVLRAVEDQNFDLAHIEWVPYARYATPGLPRVITAHNVESNIWMRRAQHAGTFVERKFFNMQADRMEAFERRQAGSCECVIAVSELDAQRFRSYGAKNVTVVPNGVDLEYFQPAAAGSQNNILLFLGSLDWFPNEDAVTDFAQHTLPLLRGKNSKIILRVVGRRPSEKLSTLLSGISGVDLIGEVPDVRSYLAEASAVVVPLRIGGGTRIKILEAMAMGKPVVSTSVGAEGLDVEDGRNLLIANNPQEFSAKIEKLLASGEMQASLARNGRAIVEKLYGWDAAAQKLEAAWMAAAGRIPTNAVDSLAMEGAAR
jgi:polysaccharide biosynthesis protein PslH